MSWQGTTMYSCTNALFLLCTNPSNCWDRFGLGFQSRNKLWVGLLVSCKLQMIFCCLFSSLFSSNWIMIMRHRTELCRLKAGEKLQGGSGWYCPRNEKRALKNKKRAPENCHRLQCKSLFNVADFSQWEVKSSPRKIKIKFLAWTWKYFSP